LVSKILLWARIVGAIKSTEEMNILSDSLYLDPFSYGNPTKLIHGISRESLNHPVLVIVIVALQPLQMLIQIIIEACREILTLGPVRASPTIDSIGSTSIYVLKIYKCRLSVPCRVQERKHVDLIILFQYTRDPEHCSRRKDHKLEGVLLELHLMEGEVLKLFKKVHTLRLNQLGHIIHLGRVV
jgi:hypothetical protein